MESRKSMPFKLNRRALGLLSGTLAGTALLAQTAPSMQNIPVRLPRKIRLGILGLEGHIGELLDPLPHLPDVELVAVSDADPAQRAKLAKQPARQYTDHLELLDHERLDVAALCGNHAERQALLLACAKRRINVVSEKPLAITTADFDEVRRAVSASGIHLSMLITMRFLPEFQALRETVFSGQIGDVVQVTAQKSYKLGKRPEWMKHRKSYGGSIPYIGIHLVDLMRFTTGRDLIHLASHETRVGHSEIGDMENTAVSIYRLDNGGHGSFHLDYCRPEAAASHGDDRLRIAGTNGIVEYQENIGVTLITASQPQRKLDPLPPAKSFFIDYLEKVYAGKPSGLSLADIYRANEIVLTARDAADTVISPQVR
jgi:predicted dehydrogenase